MKIVGAFLDSPRQCTDCLGILGVDLCNKSCLMCMRQEMAMVFGFTKWNRCWGFGREQ